MSKPPADAKSADAKTAAKPAKPDLTSTGRDRATQHIDAKRLGKY